MHVFLRRSKRLAFTCPYFPMFSPNAGKYGPEKTPYLETFHAVIACYRFHKCGRPNKQVYIQG